MCALTCIPSIAAAEPCPNEGTRLEQAYGAQLPDCRAYEQVSPVEKNLSSAIGNAGLTQVSPEGDRVTFGSLVPFPETPGSSEYPTYLSTRTASGWSGAKGLLPATPGPQGEEPAPGVVVSGFTEDLRYAVIVGFNGFLYTADAGEFSTFPLANEGFVDASGDDSRILLASSQSLPVAEGPTGIEGDPNLYEWRAGQLRLVAPDAVPGADLAPEERASSYTDHTISSGGERVFYTSLAPGASEGRIYVRENFGEPVAITEGPGPTEWRAATPDGSSVFYTESDAGRPRGTEGVIGGLYRWTRRPGETEPHTTEIAEPAVEVLGTLGISNDGTYVYFVARGELGGSNGEGNKAIGGAPNLYVWHEGASVPIHFVATLSFNGYDPDNWRDRFDRSGVEHPAEGLRSAQVTRDGEALLFTSILPLTHYESGGHSEIFLYHAPSAELVCVSCNPSGQPASANAYLSHQPIKYASEPSGRNRPFALHNLSEDGQRVFFQASEALVPGAKNGLANVYEWERGHLHLISSGQGNSPAYLGGASADGSDVFFFTGQSLVAQDQDENIDLYDARENGGIASQNDAPQPDCGEQCHGAGSAPPSFGVPASDTFVGPGNLAPQAPATPAAKPQPKPRSKPRCRRGYRRNGRGRCVRAKASRHKR